MIEIDFFNAVLGGIISKIINDSVDIPKNNIKKIVCDENISKTFLARIYNIIICALNKLTYNQYRDQDKVYDAAEILISEYEKDYNEMRAVRMCLKVFYYNVDIDKCNQFFDYLVRELCRDENQAVYREVMLKLNCKQKEEFHYYIGQHDDNSSRYYKKNVGDEFVNNKKQEYINNWNERLFLHCGKNDKLLTLGNTFIIPDYEILHCKLFKAYYEKTTLEEFLEKVIINYNGSATLLITGVPGIGKSSITSWIANKYRHDNYVLILKFRDWERGELKNGLLEAICSTFQCNKKDLNNHILILDGFDEIKDLDRRESLLNGFFNEIKDINKIKIIITSRPTYIEGSNFNVHIKILPFEINRIKEFYYSITGYDFKYNTVLNNLDVLGIPVILYMAIMSNIDITNNSTKPELYNRIFAEKGGIFDKFYNDGLEYSGGAQIFRDSQNINIFLEFLRKVSFDMCKSGRNQLESNEYEAPKLFYNMKQISVLEFPIKYLFESSNSLEFVHKSILEYFVAEYIFYHLNLINNNDDKQFGKVFLSILKDRYFMTEEIGEFLAYKFLMYNNKNTLEKLVKFFNYMLERDAISFIKKNNNSIFQECNIFYNYLEILLFIDNRTENNLSIDISLINKLYFYIKFSNIYILNSGSRTNHYYNKNLQSKIFRKIDFENVEFSEVDLSNTDLRFANFRNSILNIVRFINSNLSGADFRKAKFKNVNFSKANLYNAIFDTQNIRDIPRDFNELLRHTRIELDNGTIIPYYEYKK